MNIVNSNLVIVNFTIKILRGGSLSRKTQITHESRNLHLKNDLFDKKFKTKTQRILK